MRRRRILLVDDNPHDVELALSAFQDCGDHEVTVAVQVTWQLRG